MGLSVQQIVENLEDRDKENRPVQRDMLRLLLKLCVNILQEELFENASTRWTTALEEILKYFKGKYNKNRVILVGKLNNLWPRKR